MCDPTGVSYAGLAVAMASAAASAAAQQKSQQDAASKRNKATKQEQQRQEQYRQRAAQVMNQSTVDQALPAQDAGLATTQADRQSAIADTVRASSDYAPTTGSAPTIVNTEVARKLSQALSKGKATAANLATLGSFNDQQFKNRLALSDSSSKLGALAGFSSNSAGVLPYELNKANQSGQGWQTFGDILGATGQAAGNAAMTGAFDSWFSSSPGYGAPGRFGGAVPTGLDGRIAGGV